MVKKNSNESQTDCMWCKDKVEEGKYDLFLFFDEDEKGRVIFERPICKQCQEIFDSASDSTIKKSKGVSNGK